jgi:oligopeptidase A
MTQNPLLHNEGLPRFDEFTPAAVAPAIAWLIEQAQATLAQVKAESTPATWESFVLPLELATERLGRAWGVVGHLNAVDDNKELRDAYNAALPQITEFWTSLGSDEGLFKKYKQLADSPAFSRMNPAQQRSIQNALRDFKLGGAELQGAQKARYAQVQELQAQLSQQFSENVLDATNGFSVLITDRSRLDGMPDDAIAAAAQEALADGHAAAWKLTLRAPSYMPVMQYAHDANLRETMYHASVTRASALTPQANAEKLDNTSIIDESLALRHEEAKLLGMRNFADVSLTPKMAESPEQVISFLQDLAKRARPFAERDLNELRSFAREHLGLTRLNSWDVSYASEKLKERNYAFSENEVKQYFQAPKVLAGLFALVERLFDVRIKADKTPTWHPDVLFYRIERPEGGLIGQFYVDLFARPTKRGGAWMDDARGRAKRAGTSQTPVAYLNCNFQPPVGEKPGLLTHDDVITMFHETGHGLHHLLTQIDELAVSGINGVEWDAVELPSQFLENFAWDWQVVESMSAHVDTQAPLPRALFDKMVNAKNFQAGLQTLRQIEFSLFDMLLHSQAPLPQNAPGEFVQAVVQGVRKEVSLLPPPDYNRFQNSFSHIFAGGYAAGYYSYKWAEVLSADCFAAFEESGGINPHTGQRFLQEILSRGGSRPAIDSFRAFRGRDPQLEALLRHNGMIESPPTERSNHEAEPA